MLRSFELTLLTLLLAAASSLAQEPATRAEADRQRRAEKNDNLQRYTPGALERAMHFVEENRVYLVGREGFYPKLGSLTTGSGFAFGAGYRDRNLFENRGMLDLWAATSMRKYWAAEVRLTFPKLARNRLMLETWTAHRDYPQEDFFGIGPDSARVDQTSYAIRSDFVGTRVGVRPHPVLLAGGGLADSVVCCPPANALILGYVTEKLAVIEKHQLDHNIRCTYVNSPTIFYCLILGKLV